MAAQTHEQGFSTIIGQEENIQRLREFKALYRDDVAGHILIVGQDGTGKQRIAKAFAAEYNLAFQQTEARSIQKENDLTAILSNMEKGQVLLIENIHRLKEGAMDLIRPALQDFHLDYVVGRGIASRTIKLQLAPFTLIGTAPKVGDCPNEILSGFPLVLRMQNYSASELESLAHSVAATLGFTLPESIAKSMADTSAGKPSRIEWLVRELAKIGRGSITDEGGTEALRVMGVNAVNRGGETSLVLSSLSGTQFEHLITQLLLRMGFHAEMTKASGDGGIDIIAVLEKSILGGRYLIQCKRFAPDSLVGAPIVREFYGAFTADRKAVKGILITTSSFTVQAQEFAKGLPLELIDGDKLSSLLGEYGLPGA